MRALALTTLLALAAPAARAGNFDIDLGIFLGGHGRYQERRNDCVERRWEPGHYETVSREVCIPGHYESRYVPAVYQWRGDACGRRYRVMVRCGGYERFWVPARTEMVCEEVWVPGRWVYDRVDCCDRDCRDEHHNHSRIRVRR